MLLDADAYEPPIPDALDLVVEVADMMSIFAAQRFVRVEAMRREAMADAVARGNRFTDVVERGVRLELAAALRTTEYAAGELMRMAEAIVQRYPSVLQSLRRARMTERHAEILVTAVDELEPELRAALLPEAVELAESMPVGSFRRLLRRRIDASRAVSIAERHEAAVALRRVVAEPAADAMSWLHLYVPAVEAQAIYARATSIAKVIVAHESESRSLEQVRADVICDLLIEGVTDAHPDEARGIRATVAITVPALSLLEEHDRAREAAGLAPAVVEGVGPIPLERARELCGGVEGWMRILVHPETSTVLSVGRELYRPPAPMRRLVQWRAERCMAPGCGMPASRCEIDHTVAWESGGETRIDNLNPLCRGHHKVKHHGGWRVRQVRDSGGALEWISPAGRRYVVPPERPLHMPAFRPSDAVGAPF
ncbi:DUF222 domain-containing protein [Microbacterium sp. NPDC055455]